MHMLQPENQIVGDLGRKCADDVSRAIRRTMQLAESANDKFVIGSYGASVAMAWASAALNVMTESENPEQCADELWVILRPFVIHGLSTVARAEAGE